MVLMNLRCVPHIGTRRGYASVKRFVLSSAGTLASQSGRRKWTSRIAYFLLAIGSAIDCQTQLLAACFMDFHLRRFVDKYSLVEAMSFVNSPPPPADALRATAAFLEEAETGVSPQASIHEPAHGGARDEEAASLHRPLLALASKAANAWRPHYLIQRQIMKASSAVPGSKVKSGQRQRLPKWAESKWEFACRVAPRAPALLYFDQPRQCWHFLPIDADACDDMLCGLRLLDRRFTLKLEDVVKAS